VIGASRKSQEREREKESKSRYAGQENKRSKTCKQMYTCTWIIRGERGTDLIVTAIRINISKPRNCFLKASGRFMEST
jgi:hypothetical protein